jgi:alkanesulfonate monooxygenase SsuD/methylene tetrahydromethanopterin reductase-like flavin-dependent oxidoreductase (luciferase family)
MKVGTRSNMLNEGRTLGRRRPRRAHGHGELAEPLGFDSLFALEHHFTGYAMSPRRPQLLSYYRAAHQDGSLGTAVIVLPWHDPVRVAEQIALLDVMSGGRCLFGFGAARRAWSTRASAIPWRRRGRASWKRADRGEGLTHDVFEWDGRVLQDPADVDPPRPISHPERRFYASSVSPESAEIMAKLGFGVLVIMQNEWPKAARTSSATARSRERRARAAPPIILTNVSCAESRREARSGR